MSSESWKENLLQLSCSFSFRKLVHEHVRIRILLLIKRYKQSVPALRMTATWRVVFSLRVFLCGLLLLLFYWPELCLVFFDSLWLCRLEVSCLLWRLLGFCRCLAFVEQACLPKRTTTTMTTWDVTCPLVAASSAAHACPRYWTGRWVVCRSWRASGCCWWRAAPSWPTRVSWTRRTRSPWSEPRPRCSRASSLSWFDTRPGHCVLAPAFRSNAGSLSYKNEMTILLKRETKSNIQSVRHSFLLFASCLLRSLVWLDRLEEYVA